MSPLKQVEKVWADKARDLLAPFRNDFRELTLTQKRTDRLEQAICEALVDAYRSGRVE